MKKYMIFSLLLTLSVLTFTNCTDNDSTVNTTGRENTATKLSDGELENRIKAKFDTDAQLKAANLDIDATADRNEATLSGTVESQALRIKAVDLAKSAHTGLIVTDKIDVKPREVSRAEYTEDMARKDRERAKGYGETVGDSLDDAWIHTKVVAKLIGNADTPERKINVDVNNNTVTLRGTVDSAVQKTEAEQVAKNTEGVKRVVNQLKVGASPSPRK